MVCLAYAEYDKPDYAIICQAISMWNQMQAFLITNGPLLPVLSQEKAITTQDNRISAEEQQTATTQFYQTQLPAAKRAQTTISKPHTDNHQQRTLFNT